MTYSLSREGVEPISNAQPLRLAVRRLARHSSSQRRIHLRDMRRRRALNRLGDGRSGFRQNILNGRLHLRHPRVNARLELALLLLQEVVDPRLCVGGPVLEGFAAGGDGALLRAGSDRAGHAHEKLDAVLDVGVVHRDVKLRKEK